MAQKKKQTRKSKGGFSFVVWGLAFLVALSLFAVLLPQILDSLKKTDFFERVGRKTPQVVQEYEGASKRDAKKTGDAGVSDGIIPGEGTARKDPPSRPDVPPPPEPADAENRPAPSVPDIPETGDSVAVRAAPSGRTQLKVWFVEIRSDGTVSRKETARDVEATEAPLTSAVRALLGGPTAPERGKGCDTLIPDGTRLISAAVKNGVATLNFSEEFQYNTYGVEGYMGQLMQVVYTATAFPTVDSVQFLIEGEHGEYIGSEGVWIGSPLSRSSFR
jgi:hypothetical protein